MGVIFSAVAIVIVSLFYLHAAYDLPHSNQGDPVGPATFPMIIGFGLLLSAAALLVQELKKRRDHEGSWQWPLSQERQRHLFVLVSIVVWTIFYYMAFEPIGYVLSTVVYIFILLTYFQPARWKSNFVIAVSFTLCADGLFTYGLRVTLPPGLLGLS